MFKHSLKAKILMLVNLAILTIIILLSTTFYHSQKELLIQQSYLNLKSVGAEISRGIADWIKVRHSIIDGLSKNVDSPELVTHLVQARTSGNFALTFYGDENGFSCGLVCCQMALLEWTTALQLSSSPDPPTNRCSF